MKIIVHIGPDAVHSERLQQVLSDKRDNLAGKGVLFARSPGKKNHTRLYMAVTPPDRPDSLRFNRGFGSAEQQDRLRQDTRDGIGAEIDKVQPHTLIVSAHQFGSGLTSRVGLETLRDVLRTWSDDISVVAHVEDPGRMLARNVALQAADGRGSDLSVELELVAKENWWQAALDAAPDHAPLSSVFADVQAPAAWLDFMALAKHWDSVFGKGATRFRSIAPEHWSEAATDELCQAFGIDGNIGKAEPVRIPRMPSAAFLTRATTFNALFLQLAAKENLFLPRMMWRRILGEMVVSGDPVDAGSLSTISLRFEKANKTLLKSHPDVSASAFKRDRKKADWTPADPGFGFRASQYLAAFAPRLREVSTEEATKRGDSNPAASPQTPKTNPITETRQPAPLAHASAASQIRLSPSAERLMPARAKENFDRLRHSPYAPHNRLGQVNEEELAAAFAPMPARRLEDGSTGNVIVGCMKNEAPYIVEWVAYHRAIGVDNFLIYTNGCEDGTSEILDRLNVLGIVEHRNNDNWKGNSPQQHALNQALKEPVIQNADWIIHIDVDEFINVRCGNGTLDDFFERVPDATNVAMTWRLFGHNGVTALEDRLVIDQFDTCAPKFCPKPHTVWGFKTMFKNIGAYAKISCHRPNKLDDAFQSRVKWVNGSGRDMTGEVIKNGWRNSKKSIGYDLLQLNHYALRSAESFLIKRQRGRALHVDRSIGLNYWIRMDWSGARDITIKRNIPRLQAEYDRLMADPELKRLHMSGLDWHHSKARELHANPEFEELYQKAIELKLTETERVAYALALDMES